MSIKIHKEGKKIILFTVLILISVNIFLYLIISISLIKFLISFISLLLIIFILRFFRVPQRKINNDENIIYSSADGKVVAVEEVYEDEYFKDKRILVSIFMSVWNVHINWFPAISRIIYFNYHPGKYLVARHPKSSTLNERTTTVIAIQDSTEIMIRQIAGYVARRIVCYSIPDKWVQSGDELGFIKFGSRVDVFLPLSATLKVNIGDKVKGITTPVALLKKD